MKKCEIQGKCGGCTLLDKEYNQQLKEKTQFVQTLLSKVKPNIKVCQCIGMQEPYHYRNKGKYALKNGKMGFYEEGTHKIVYAKCIIQKEIINEIAEFTFELIKKYKINIYNEDIRKGFLRHIVIRYGVYTDEVMIIFVTTSGKMYKREEIIKELTSKYKNIKSVVQNINERDTNAILGNKIIKLYGSDFIVDKINNLKFKISPLSFYQVNPVQMEKLYSIAIEEASVTNNDIVYDLYSGIGTISLCLSKKAKRVYGIEIVKDAVKDAKENARINNIKNTEFMVGKVEDLLPRLCAKQRADTVFVDPPRSGLDIKTIQTILKVKPDKLVYISCNPETLAENLKELTKCYNIVKVQPVDMFPFTSHVECVAVLCLK